MNILGHSPLDHPLPVSLICDTVGVPQQHPVEIILVYYSSNFAAIPFFCTLRPLTSLECGVLIHFTTMSDSSPTSYHAKAIRVLTGMLPMLDASDASDNALKMVSIIFGLCCVIFM